MSGGGQQQQQQQRVMRPGGHVMVCVLCVLLVGTVASAERDRDHRVYSALLHGTYDPSSVYVLVHATDDLRHARAPAGYVMLRVIAVTVHLPVQCRAFSSVLLMLH